MKIISLIICLLLGLAACSKKENKNQIADFETLMGKGLTAWQHIHTNEDQENLNFFKSTYEHNFPLIAKPKNGSKIPKVIHFIWLGPKTFPIDSIENVRSWIGKHPNWKYKFWTDRDRPLPHPAMEKVLVKDFTFIKLGRFFYDSDNFGEKSDVLRYEILFQEGGVYVDHDVKCLKAFDEISDSYDFFCGLEMPYKTTLSSSVLPTNNIVGSKPGHLMLIKCIDWLVANWEQIEKDYPGRDRDSIINRVAHRTFFVLGENFKKFANTGENKDIAFPAFFFNAPKEENGLYAHHQYAGTWFENESEFEKMVRKRLMMLSKKTNKLLLFLTVLSGLNLIGFGALYWKPRLRKLW